MGESFTPGDVFDSVPFRGVQLASDMGMLPDSMQGYAPVIRGIAETQAKVEVRQNGYSLYTTYVAPGAFEINDLNAASGSGDLEVIITEADGRERRFTQPYATLANMLRENTWRYSATVGEYNSANGGERPMFTQASLAYGLPFDLTLYGGFWGRFYRAGVVGVGKSLGSIGAVSIDVTQAQTDVPKAVTTKGESKKARASACATARHLKAVPRCASPVTAIPPKAIATSAKPWICSNPTTTASSPSAARSRPASTRPWTTTARCT